MSLNNNIFDILFLEGDKFFRELTQHLKLNAMPITSDLKFILMIIDFLLDESINEEILKKNIKNFLMFEFNNDFENKKFEKLT